MKQEGEVAENTNKDLLTIDDIVERQIELAYAKGLRRAARIIWGLECHTCEEGVFQYGEGETCPECSGMVEAKKEILKMASEIDGKPVGGGENV